MVLSVEPVWTLGSACLGLACCFAAGRVFAGLARLSLAGPVQFLLGAGLFSQSVLALGLAGWVNRAAFLVLAAVALGAAAMVRVPGPPVGTRPGWLGWVLAPFGIVYLVHAMAPEISPDGLAYHVALPLRYLREGRVGFVPFNIYGQLSQGMEMLYLFVLSMANRSAAALVHLGFVFALVALLWDYGRSVANRWVAFTACSLVFCSPVAGIDAASAYTDVAVAAVLFGLYVVLARWRNEPSLSLAVAAGVLAGFAYGIKYTAGLGVALGFVWLMRRDGRAATLFLAASLAMMLPWLGKNWAFTGNPWSPFANAWFPNAVFDRWLEADYVGSLRWYPGLGTAATLPWELAGRGFILNGFLGPIWLLAPLSLLALRTNEGRRLLAVGFLVGIPFALNVGTRFLIPAMPFFALALAMALSRWRWLLVGVGAAHLLLSWPWLAPLYCERYAWRIAEFPWRAALRLESEDEFQGRKLTEHHMARHLNAFVRPGEKVLTQTQFTDALTHADMLTGALSRPTVEWRRMLYLTAVPRLLPNGRIRFWFLTKPYRALRLRQLSGAPASVAECRVYRLLTPVQPSSRGPALDGSTLTRVVLGEPLEVDLATPAEVDRVDCLYHSIPPEPDFVLEAQRADGAWVVASSQPELAPYVDSAQGLPAQAARLLLQQGIRFLLLRDRDYHRDLGGLTPELNMAGWPVERLASEYGMHLYRIDPNRLKPLP